jgi:hypothetical protein
MRGLCALAEGDAPVELKQAAGRGDKPVRSFVHAFVASIGNEVDSLPVSETRVVCAVLDDNGVL